MEDDECCEHVERDERDDEWTEHVEHSEDGWFDEHVGGNHHTVHLTDLPCVEELCAKMKSIFQDN